MTKRTLLLCWLLLVGATAGAALPVTVTDNRDTSSSAPLFSVYEITLSHSASSYANPFREVLTTATFHSPNLRTYVVRGYYHDLHTWKIRFMPDVEGDWTWNLSMSASGDQFTTSGGIRVVSSPYRGFMQRHPANNYRWIRQDGRPFYPMGVQTFEQANYKVLEGSDDVLVAFGIGPQAKKGIPKDRWGDLVLEKVALLDIEK